MQRRCKGECSAGALTIADYDCQTNTGCLLHTGLITAH